MINRNTLDEWAGKSLEERVRLFHRRYSNSKTSIYKIRKLYANHNIKKKVIRIGKTPKQASLMDIVLQAADLRQDVLAAIDMRRKIVQLDEFVITKKTLPTHVWTLPRTNL